MRYVANPANPVFFLFQGVCISVSFLAIRMSSNSNYASTDLGIIDPSAIIKWKLSVEPKACIELSRISSDRNAIDTTEVDEEPLPRQSTSKNGIYLLLSLITLRDGEVIVHEEFQTKVVHNTKSPRFIDEIVTFGNEFNIRNQLQQVINYVHTP